MLLTEFQRSGVVPNTFRWQCLEVFIIKRIVNTNIFMKTKSYKGSLLGSNSGISLWHYTRLSQPSQLTTVFSSGYGMI